MLNRLRLGHWIGTCQNGQRDELLGTAPSLTPEGRQIAISKAREIMIVLGNRLPVEVEEWLSQRTKPHSVDLLCNDFPDAGYLLGLLEQGYRLFDAFVPRQTLVFLDRRHCYRLPDWETVLDGFSLACNFLWSKTGYYADLEGTVTEIAPQGRMFKLTVNEYYWTWVTLPADCETPAIGARVKVLGISSWIGGATAHLIQGALVTGLSKSINTSP